MSIQEEIFRLRTEEVGSEKVDELKLRLESLRQELVELNEGFTRGSVHLSQYQSFQSTLEQQIRRTESELGKLIGSGPGGGGGGRGGAGGQGIMGLSFAVQDFLSAGGNFSQALYRIQNNIPVLLYQMGAPSGLAGTISLVTLAIGELLPKVIEWVNSFSSASEVFHTVGGEIEGLHKRIEELSKLASPTAFDIREMDQKKARIKELKEGEEGWAKATEAQSQTEKRRGELVSEAFKKMGDDFKQSSSFQRLIQKDIDENVNRQEAGLKAQSAEIKRWLDDFYRAGGPFSDTLESQREQLEKQIRNMGEIRIQEEKKVANRIGFVYEEAIRGNEQQLDVLIKKLEETNQKDVAIRLQHAKDRLRIERETAQQELEIQLGIGQQMDQKREEQRKEQDAKVKAAAQDELVRQGMARQARDRAAAEAEARGGIQPGAFPPIGPLSILPPGFLRGPEARVARGRAELERKKTERAVRLVARRARKQERLRRVRERRLRPAERVGRLEGRLAGQGIFQEPTEPLAKRPEAIDQALIRAGFQGLSVQEKNLIATGRLLNMAQVLAARQVAVERRMTQLLNQVNQTVNGHQQQAGRIGQP